MCARQKERDRETESEKSAPRQYCNPFSSRDLGHAHAHARAHHELKSPGLGLKPQSTTRESSDIAIMPTAGPWTWKDF